ncbi:UPF0160 protein MYG1, mitochondrial isoform X3 [Parus major]|uniref:UPF0160 protein MYG1, mitochondrial isoform X3 n=1 Tax=Parus major TaxID=9157 RepID=UPI00077101B4|nr:UPF0160 protein MYG1, mitochondrial isoform X3 [Parus major]
MAGGVYADEGGPSGGGASPPPCAGQRAPPEPWSWRPPGREPAPGTSGRTPSPPLASAPTTAPSTATRRWRVSCCVSCPATGTRRSCGRGTRSAWPPVTWWWTWGASTTRGGTATTTTRAVRELCGGGRCYGQRDCASGGGAALRPEHHPECPRGASEPPLERPRPGHRGFRRAMELAGSEFLQRLDFYHRAWLPARALVEEAVRHRFEVDASGQVLELSQGGCPWKEHVFQLERELALPKPLQLVLFPDRGGQWRVQSVPTAPHSFQSRLPLPEAWRGLRDEALSELAGIPGCIFVHASGFIGGNQTREGALEMARRALELGGGTEST